MSISWTVSISFYVGDENRKISELEAAYLHTFEAFCDSNVLFLTFRALESLLGLLNTMQRKNIKIRYKKKTTRFGAMGDLENDLVHSLWMTSCAYHITDHYIRLSSLSIQSAVFGSVGISFRISYQSTFKFNF